MPRRLQRKKLSAEEKVSNLQWGTLRSEDRQKLDAFLKALGNPVGIPVAFHFLDAKEYNLSRPVIVGTDTYIAAKVARVPQLEIAYGYEVKH